MSKSGVEKSVQLLWIGGRLLLGPYDPAAMVARI